MTYPKEHERPVEREQIGRVAQGQKRKGAQHAAKGKGPARVVALQKGRSNHARRSAGYEEQRHARGDDAHGVAARGHQGIHQHGHVVEGKAGGEGQHHEQGRHHLPPVVDPLLHVFMLLPAPGPRGALGLALGPQGRQDCAPSPPSKVGHHYD